jgi:hypothetical protein
MNSDLVTWIVSYYPQRNELNRYYNTLFKKELLYIRDTFYLNALQELISFIRLFNKSLNVIGDLYFVEEEEFINMSLGLSHDLSNITSIVQTLLTYKISLYSTSRRALPLYFKLRGCLWTTQWICFQWRSSVRTELTEIMIMTCGHCDDILEDIHIFIKKVLSHFIHKYIHRKKDLKHSKQVQLQFSS